MAQLEMFGQNIFLILGALLVLAFGSLMLVVLWTGLRVWLFTVQQRRAQRACRRRTRRADGKMYPPAACGVCDACGRVGKAIYYPASGEKLCAPCYEDFWRRTEVREPGADESPPAAPVAKEAAMLGCCHSRRGA